MKSIPITPEILAQIKAATGTAIDPNSITVFRAVALDTTPLRKVGSIWNGAVPRSGMLAEMAAYLNGPNGGVALQTLHNDDELPVGRLFYGQLADNQLQVLFYLSNATQSALINDINTGVINSDSVGVKSKQLLCSECGWDYYGQDASFVNFFDQTCANGHTIGTDGVHLEMVGLDRWYEMSLVSTGASPNAKILSASVFNRVKAQVGQEELTRLAAAGVPLQAHVFVSNPTKSEEEAPMKDLLDKVEAQATEIAELKVKLSAETAKIAEVEAQLTAANAKIAEIEPKIAAADETVAKLTAAEAKIEKNDGFLRTQAQKALVATGRKATDVPEDADTDALIATIEGAGVNLVNLFASGGRAAAPALGSEGKSSNSAYKTRG